MRTDGAFAGLWHFGVTRQTPDDGSMRCVYANAQWPNLVNDSREDLRMS